MKIEKPALWDTMVALISGFSQISFEEFSKVLRETIGAQADYTQSVWPRFLNHPIGYCQSRSSIDQGYALFRLAAQKGGFGEVAQCEAGARKKVEVRVTLSEWAGADIQVFVNGEAVTGGHIGGEPEDNTYYRDYSWIDGALCSLARALGAEVEFKEIQRAELEEE